MNPANDVILAFGMNSRVLHPDHGYVSIFPLRWEDTADMYVSVAYPSDCSRELVRAPKLSASLSLPLCRAMSAVGR